MANAVIAIRRTVDSVAAGRDALDLVAPAPEGWDLVDLGLVDLGRGG